MRQPLAERMFQYNHFLQSIRIISMCNNYLANHMYHLDRKQSAKFFFQNSILKVINFFFPPFLFPFLSCFCFRGVAVAVVISSPFYQLIISPIHGLRGGIWREEGADFQIFSFMLPATKPSMVWGRAERAPNDDRKREFVNSKSNYLGEVTFPPQGDSGTRDVSTSARIHLSRMKTECKERHKYWLFSIKPISR